jgi:hypothetical protein
VGVHGIVKMMWRGTLSFSAQWVCPYAGGFATIASAMKGLLGCSGSGCTHAPQLLYKISLTCSLCWSASEMLSPGMMPLQRTMAKVPSWLSTCNAPDFVHIS